MDRSKLLLVVPALATALVVFVTFGPGQERTVKGARVLVAAGEPAGVRSLRIETIERGAPIPRATEVPDLQIFVDGDAEPLWRGSSGPFGVADAKLRRPVPSGARVRVRTGDRTLAEGQLRTASSEPASPSFQPAKLEGVAEGELTVSAEAAAGTLVPSIAGGVVVTVSDRSGAVSDAKLTMKATAVEPAELEVDVKNGRALLSLAVIAPPAAVELTARAEGRTGTLRAELPTTMGAIAAVAANGRVELVSPAPREVAFVSLFDEAGRVGGAVVLLEASPDGYFRGSLPIERGVAALTVSSDAREASGSTVTWPGEDQSGLASAPRLSVAVDGMPQALQAEATRLSRVRTATTAALSLAAALEIALLLWTRREARAALAKTDENAPDGLPYSRASNQPVWGFLAAISALVLLALVAVVGLVVLR